MKKYLDLNKYSPAKSMELLLEYDSKKQVIYFSGKKTPKKYCGKGDIAVFNIKEINFTISSYDHPQLSIDPYSDFVQLYLGGETTNPDTFREDYYVGYDMRSNRDIINLFCFQLLNTKIRVI